MFRRHAIGLIVISILLLGNALSACADTNWILPPAVWGDWSVSQNWSSGVPNSFTNANITNGGTASVASSVTCKTLQIGTIAGSGTVNITGGSLSMVNGMAYVGDTGKGNVIQTGGTFNVPAGFGLFLGGSAGSVGTYTLVNGLVSGQCELLGSDGEAHFIQSGGTNSVEGWFQMASNVGSSATYELKGGLLSTATSSEAIGSRGNAHFIQSGGINKLATATGTGTLILSSAPSSVASYDLSGGELLTYAEWIGNGGPAVFTQSGGTNTAVTGVSIGYYSSGTYNLNGGTLITNMVYKGAGTAVFNFGGGTLKASETFSTPLPMTLTGNNGNANVDTTNGDVTLSGILSGSGGLNKLGTGKLTLSATNTYSGETDILGGILCIAKPYMSDVADVRISGANLNLTFSGSDTIHSLYLDGCPMAIGTWGSSSSGATHIDNVHFSGRGKLNVVAIPEPSTLALLGIGGIGLTAFASRRQKAQRIVVCFIALLVSTAGMARADTFGTGANQFTLDFVPISGATNPTSGYGIVNYGYRMGTYEITNDQWNKFTAAFGTVTGSPASAYDSSFYNYGTGTTNVPTNNVSWYEAAQFVNWLNTSTGHQAAYKFTGTQGQSDYTFAVWSSTDAGYDAANPYRNQNAYYFLPMENEWVKAAYWNGTALQTYATKPGESLAQGHGAGTGWNYFDNGYATNPHGHWNVGSGSQELNGTYDMMGNAREWTESPYYDPSFSAGSSRGLRGGYWLGISDLLQSSFRYSYGYSPTYEVIDVGFRVASVPEPGSLAMLLTIAVSGLIFWRQKA